MVLIIGGTLINLIGCTMDESKKIEQIHAKAITVDTHCDTPMALLGEGFNVGERNEAPKSRVDFPRMQEGGLDAIFFAAFTGQRERTPENTERAYEMANQMIEKTYEVCKVNSDIAEVATEPEMLSGSKRKGKKPFILEWRMDFRWELIFVALRSFTRKVFVISRFVIRRTTMSAILQLIKKDRNMTV